MLSPAAKFPLKIWQCIASHLRPREWFPTSSVSETHRNSNAKAQLEQANLWAEILPKELPEMKTDEGKVIDPVLVGRIKGIGKAGQKPYIFLGTTPYGERPSNWRYIRDLMDDMNNQEQHDERIGADHGTFCLNTKGFLARASLMDGFVELSNEESASLLEGEIYALRSNTPGIFPVKVRIRPGFIKGLTELIIRFDEAYFPFIDFKREYKAQNSSDR